MNTHDLPWGFWMMGAGMGTVFLLLAILMGLLLLIGALDRAMKPKQKAIAASEPAPELTAEPSGVAASEVLEPRVEILHDGLTRDQIAAVTMAVITHARVRRAQAAPAMRSHQPGSHLYASRWVSVGRGQQNTSWRRN